MNTKRKSLTRTIPIDSIKHLKETEKSDLPDTEIKHNFEAEIYLEKLDHETEKVI